MPRVRFNRGNVKSDFTPLDEGVEYEVEVLKFNPSTSKKGNATIKADYQVFDGPEQVDGNPSIGRHLFDTLYAEDDGKAFSLGRALECFNIDGEGEEFDTDDVVGARGRVTVEHEIYEGKTQERVKYVL